MSVTADPRVRARQVAVARQAGHRRLHFLTAGLCALALAVSAFVVLHSSLLSAQVVHVEGGPHEPRAELLAVTGLSRRPPLIDISPTADEAAIDRLAWVRSSRVRLDWPTGVTVSITERRPVAYVALQGGTGALLDPTGRVLAKGVAVPSSLVALRGLGPVGAPGTTLAGASRMLAVAAALPPSTAGQVRDLELGPSGGVDIHLWDKITVVLGSPSALRAKMIALATVLARVPLDGIVMIDLEVPSQPVLTR